MFNVTKKSPLQNIKHYYAKSSNIYYMGEYKTSNQPPTPLPLHGGATWAQRRTRAGSCNCIKRQHSSKHTASTAGNLQAKYNLQV